MQIVTSTRSRPEELTGDRLTGCLTLHRSHQKKAADPRAASSSNSCIGLLRAMRPGPPRMYGSANVLLASQARAMCGIGPSTSHQRESSARLLEGISREDPKSISRPSPEQQHGTARISSTRASGEFIHTWWRAPGRAATITSAPASPAVCTVPARIALGLTRVSPSTSLDAFATVLCMI